MFRQKRNESRKFNQFLSYFNLFFLYILRGPNWYTIRKLIYNFVNSCWYVFTRNFCRSDILSVIWQILDYLEIEIWIMTSYRDLMQLSIKFRKSNWFRASIWDQPLFWNGIKIGFLRSCFNLRKIPHGSL